MVMEAMNTSEPKFSILPSKPLILIISGLSGAGKDTVINHLNKTGEFDFHFVVTCNTRDKREGEVDGRDYHFLTREKFTEMIENGEMIEHSRVYDDYKGVPRFEIERAFADGKDMILRIDFQGMQKVKKVYPEAVSIFIIPPDAQTWLERLHKRGSDTPEALQTRIHTAAEELACVPQFDYLVVNEDIEKAAAEILMIVQAEHFRTSRRKVNYS